MINYFRQLWQKRCFAKRINLKQNLVLFNQYYKNIDGYSASLQENKERFETSKLYGEVDFYHFAALLSLVQPKIEDVFVDLGSGVGKACLTAALAFDIKYCLGIEIVPKLHEQALAVYEKCPVDLQNKLIFICGDYLKQQLSDASIVFINATALFGEEWSMVEKHLIEQLSTNTRLLVSSKTLPSKYFKHLALKPVMMDYGQSHVNLYIKMK